MKKESSTNLKKCLEMDLKETEVEILKIGD